MQVYWLEEFISKIDSKKEVEFAIDRGAKKIVFFMEWEAKIFTPVDTWVLRNSFRASKWSLGWVLVNFRDYWIFIHEWTRFMKWTPFMKKAIDENEQETTLIMNEELHHHLNILK